MERLSNLLQMIQRVLYGALAGGHLALNPGPLLFLLASSSSPCEDCVRDCRGPGPRGVLPWAAGASDPSLQLQSFPSETPGALGCVGAEGQHRQMCGWKERDTVSLQVRDQRQMVRR